MDFLKMRALVAKAGPRVQQQIAARGQWLFAGQQCCRLRLARSATFSSSSFLGTATSLRSRFLNRAASSLGGGIPFAFFLPMTTLLGRGQLAREPLVGQATAGDGAEH